MKLEEMKELIQALSESDVDKFEYKDDDFSVKLSKKKERVLAAPELAVPPVPAAAPAPQNTPEALPEVKEAEGNAVGRSRSVRAGRRYGDKGTDHWNC